jgi:hypothetical protein
MVRRSGFQVCGWIVGLCLLATFLVACESRDKYVGTYRTEATGPAKQEVVVLELRANGDGAWKIISDGAKGTPVEVPFAWYIKRGDLRINTKEGGVIVGKIKKDIIQITLPGPKALTFRRTQ